MSDFDDEGPVEQEGQSDGPTGYGKPPIKHRFPKGMTGNPNGRPKGSRRLPKIEAAEDRLVDIVRAEGRRMISVREGDVTRQMPTKEIIVRNTFTAAAKGDLRALKASIEMLGLAERDSHEQTGELQRASLQLQAYWMSWCKHVRSEFPGLDTYPEPAHVKIDPASGFAIWKSPWLKKRAKVEGRLGENRNRRLAALADVRSGLHEVQQLYGRAMNMQKLGVALLLLQQSLEERGALAEAHRYWDAPERRRLEEMTSEERRAAFADLVRQAMELPDPKLNAPPAGRPSA